MENISIRAHCIPASNIISNLNKVVPIPIDLANMEDETAGGLITKLKSIIKSKYFKSLPENKEIQSGYMKIIWNKQQILSEANRIINEIKI